MKLLKDKVLVVTGAGNGVGRALTLHLLKSGARVAAVDISETFLKETVRVANVKKDQLGTFVLDITDSAAVAKLPGLVIEKFGQVDGLINNAGIIQPFVKIMHLQSQDVHRVMDINFFGTLSMIQAFLPHLVKRPEASLVNISSMGGFVPVPGQTLYGASKAAVKLLTEGLYSELKGTSVKVSVVFPGAIGTNITKNSGVDMNMSKEDAEKMAKSQKTLSPEKAAEIIIKQGVIKEKFRVLVGKDATMLDRLSRFFPKFAADTIAKAMKSLLK
jgi:NADP-dependent 3-hydroxy acid dehydrogenase YdfG